MKGSDSPVEREQIQVLAQEYAVIGAGGKTGQACVSRLLEVFPESRVRAIVRDSTKYASLFPKQPRVVVVQGDATDLSSITLAVGGCAGVIWAASGKGWTTAQAVDCLGLENAAKATKAAGAHLVVVSSMLVTPKNWLRPMRLILNNVAKWRLMDHKFAGEQAVRASGVSYTIVRPGGLSNAPGHSSAILTAQGDHGGIQGSYQISRLDLAAVCVEALRNAAASNGLTFECVAKPQPDMTPAQYQTSLAAVFAPGQLQLNHAA